VLDEEVDVDRRAVAQEQLPEKISLAALELGRDVGGVDPFQGLEVELLDPWLVDEPAVQLFDQPRMREQRSVTEIVLAQDPLLLYCPFSPFREARVTWKRNVAAGIVAGRRVPGMLRRDFATSHLDRRTEGREPASLL
jgi:hypothetical protein